MDSLHLGIALTPLAVYLLVVGLINVSRRPLVTNGARDTAALGIGIAGFVIVGPMELFVPEATAQFLQSLLWPLLLTMYGLCLTLIVLLMRPRLVIYGIRPERVRSLLAELVSSLDPHARWAGECLIIPALGVQLHVEGSTVMRNVQLISAGANQSYEGWQRLEKALSRALQEVPADRNPYGFSLIGFALLFLAMITFRMVREADTVAADFQEMLRVSAPAERTE